MALVLSNKGSPKGLNLDERLWLYNGLDCCITREVFDTIHGQLDRETTALVYKFERALMGPAYTMQKRGIKVDLEGRKELIEGEQGLIARKARLEKNLDKIAHGLWGKPLNINSHVQLKAFFFDFLFVPPIYKFDKGQRKLSCDRASLEKMKGSYARTEPIVNHILKIRELKGQIDVLSRGISPDGRFRFGPKIAGTETGRWSTGPTPFWFKDRDGRLLKEGGSIQNWTKEVRRVLVPDPGYRMFYLDLEQAESRAVAYLSRDENYIHACESGDLHTTVATMVWPHISSREEAEELYYRHFSYRDLSKRGGHLTNYWGTPPTMAKQLQIDQRTAWGFQLDYLGGEVDLKKAIRLGWVQPGALEKTSIAPNGVVDRDGYFVCEGAFPGIARWHREIVHELQSTGTLTTPAGRRRQFWSRLSDKSTIREAIAYKPQSLIAEILNLGMLRIWQNLEPRVQLLLQLHDAVALQIKEDDIDEYLPKAIDCLTIPVEVEGRTMLVPVSCKGGYNWKEVS